MGPAGQPDGTRTAAGRTRTWARRRCFGAHRTFALDALALAGLIETRQVGNERRIALARPGEILPGLRPPVGQPDWVARFGVALEVVRFAGRGGMSASVRAIEARHVVEALRSRILGEGLPQPNFGARGDDFSAAFDEWTDQLADSLRSPSPD